MRQLHKIPLLIFFRLSQERTKGEIPAALAKPEHNNDEFSKFFDTDIKNKLGYIGFSFKVGNGENFPEPLVRKVKKLFRKGLHLTGRTFKIRTLNCSRSPRITFAVMSLMRSGPKPSSNNAMAT